MAEYSATLEFYGRTVVLTGNFRLQCSFTGAVVGTMSQ